MIWILKIFLMIGEFISLCFIVTLLETFLEGFLIRDRMSLKTFHRCNDTLHVSGLLLTWFILIETLHLHLTLG